MAYALAFRNSVLPTENDLETNSTETHMSDHWDRDIGRSDCSTFTAAVAIINPRTNNHST